jgi:7,8-dihydropterin-6-yl-methyl-4-(beta-D-ribofuranosyl)aminobenzene 5'-phosphate synthase
MKIELRPVDKVDVTTLVDNHIDQVMPGNERVTRPTLLRGPQGGRPLTLSAEHGFSAFIRLYQDGKTRDVLLDAGLSGRAVVENAENLGLDLAGVETIVISHGHLDHVGGLDAVAEKLPRTVPVVVHPDAFLKRFIVRPDGSSSEFPDFTPEMYEGRNLDFVITDKPTTIAGGTVAVTGQIPRLTDYEKGFPVQQALREGRMTPDPLMHDDQALVFVVKDKGPVIVTGCGHAGCINTVRYALELVGADKPYAVMGGFHLLWPTPEESIQRTLAAFKKLDPQFIVPCHCTGWEPTNRIALAMPDAFILNTVGATIHF